MHSSTLLVLVVCFLVGVSCEQTTCPVSLRDGSVVKCYFANYAFGTFVSTRNVCKMLTSKTGNLAILNKKEKVQSLVSNSDYFLKGEAALSYWIGLKYNKQQKMWVWQDGTPLSASDYTNWATINKGDLIPAKESCASINLYSAMAQNASADQGRWHIDDCDAPRPSLCETNIAKELPQPKLSEMIKTNPERAALFFEKQPKGQSCVGGILLARFNQELLCQQYCLVNTECVGYIVPVDGNGSCITKGKGCRSTFVDTMNIFYKKMHKQKGWLAKKADLETAE